MVGKHFKPLMSNESFLHGFFLLCT